MPKETQEARVEYMPLSDSYHVEFYGMVEAVNIGHDELFNTLTDQQTFFTIMASDLVLAG